MICENKEFQTYKVHITNSLRDTTERSHITSPVPACFNPLLFINDLRYLDCDTILQILLELSREKVDSKVLQKLFKGSYLNLK